VADLEGRIMNTYERHVLPWLIHLAMRTTAAGVERARIVPLASGIVVEIGAGSGLNLPYYGPQVARLYALDPSAPLLRMARRAATRGTTVEWIEGQAEAIPLDQGIADTVVTTWTLCSIADPMRALDEVRRVLRPEGHLLFVEHGRAPDLGVRTWQARLTPTWRRVAGGCHLDRPIDALLQAAGFTLETLSTGYGVGPRPFVYLYRGVARPAGASPARARLAPGDTATPEEVGRVG
jgi:ubiquinone/menaquinone biosynthesis C-methylase UbiE